ncbi:MAG: phosphate ABC transporter permease subunit PstC [Candidatus Helarchaeota archaeon]
MSENIEPEFNPLEFKESLKSRKIRRISNLAIKIILFSTAILATIMVFLIIINLFIQAVPALKNLSEILTSDVWHPTTNQFGAVTIIIGTLLSTMLALIIAVPISLGAAIFISELAPKKIKTVLKTATELLAGIPSIIFGFFGYLFLSEVLYKNLDIELANNWAVASIILAIMIMPIIISVANDAIDAVPREIKEGSCAIGATKWQTISKVTLPAGRSGIIAAIVLGMGRAMGETMAVAMTIGGATRIPIPITNIFESIRTITSTIVTEAGEADPVSLSNLFLLGFILFIIVIIINTISMIISWQIKKIFRPRPQKETMWTKLKQRLEKFKNGLKENQVQILKYSSCGLVFLGFYLIAILGVLSYTYTWQNWGNQFFILQGSQIYRYFALEPLTPAYPITIVTWNLIFGTIIVGILVLYIRFSPTFNIHAGDLLNILLLDAIIWIFFHVLWGFIYSLIITLLIGVGFIIQKRLSPGFKLSKGTLMKIILAGFGLWVFFSWWGEVWLLIISIIFLGFYIGVNFLKPTHFQYVAYTLLTICMTIVLVALGFILWFVFQGGLQVFINDPEFITRPFIEGGGIPEAFIGSFQLILGTITFAAIIGIPAGIFLADYAKEGKLKSFIVVGIDNLNGTPSIVFGIFGMAFFVNPWDPTRGLVGLNMGISMIAGQITLALMILPTIIRTTEEAVKAVPVGVREGSLALGATKWQTTYKTVLPAAAPGVITGMVLGMGRAAGETAPILFTAATTGTFFLNVLPNKPVMALPTHMWFEYIEAGDESMLFATAIVLLLLTLMFYSIAIVLRSYYKKRLK